MGIVPAVEFSFGPGISCMAVSGLIFVLMSQLLLQFLNNSLKHDLDYHKFEQNPSCLHTIQRSILNTLIKVH